MFSDAVGPRRVGPSVIRILGGQAELVGVIPNLAHNIPLLRRSRVYSARPHQLRLSRRSKRQSSSRRRGGPPITGAEIRSCRPAETGFPGSRGAHGRMCSPKSRSRLRRRWFSCSTNCPCSQLWCMEPRWCDRPFPGWLAYPDCVWFRRTDRAIECVDLHGDFGLLGLECASGELAAVEPLDASHGCFAKRSQSVALSFLPVHPSLRRDLRRMVLPFRSAMRRVRGRNGCGAWRDDDFRW